MYQRTIPQVGGVELNKTVTLAREAKIFNIYDIENGSIFLVTFVVWANGLYPTSYVSNPSLVNCELLYSFTSDNQIQAVTNYYIATYTYVLKANSSSLRVTVNSNGSYVYTNNTSIMYKSV